MVCRLSLAWWGKRFPEVFFAGFWFFKNSKFGFCFLFCCLIFVLFHTLLSDLVIFVVHRTNGPRASGHYSSTRLPGRVEWQVKSDPLEFKVGVSREEAIPPSFINDPHPIPIQDPHHVALGRLLFFGEVPSLSVSTKGRIFFDNFFDTCFWGPPAPPPLGGGGVTGPPRFWKEALIPRLLFFVPFIFWDLCWLQVFPNFVVCLVKWFHLDFPLIFLEPIF